VPRAATVRDLRRGQIIAAAREIVAGRGLEALTVGALEQRLDFTRGVITYHFRDKDEIVKAVLASAIDEIDRATAAEVQASLTFPEKLEAVLRTKVRGFLENREAAHILLSFWGRILHDRRVREVNARLYRTYRAQSERLLADGRKAGVFAAVPAGALAALLVGTVIGIVVQAIFEPGAIDPDACVREAARALLARLNARPGPRRRSGRPPPA
jgi:AcrR family transcriptional regulator